MNNKIKTAWLTTNRTCNNSCTWCYAHENLSCSDKMNLEDAIKAVDQLSKMGVERIVLIGGESTIYPYFFELLEYIKKKRIKVNLPTNGRKFKDPEFAEMVKKIGINGVDLSFKGYDRESYKKNTCVDGFDEAIEGYKQMKKYGINPWASYVITNDSKEEFNKFFDMIVANDISRVKFLFVKPELNLEKQEDVMPVDKMGAFVDYIYEKFKDTDIIYNLEISFPICLIKEETWEKLVKEQRVSSCCGITKGRTLIFNEKFKILPCNHFSNFAFSDKPIDLDNIDKEIEMLYNSDIYKMFVEKALSYPTLKCQGCSKWNICGGGCFTRWLVTDPNTYIK